MLQGDRKYCSVNKVKGFLASKTLIVNKCIPQYVYSSLRQINQATTEATYPRLFDGKTTSVSKRILFIYRKSANQFLVFHTNLQTSLNLSLNVTSKTTIKLSLIIHLQSIKVDFCLKQKKMLIDVIFFFI